MRCSIRLLHPAISLMLPLLASLTGAAEAATVTWKSAVSGSWNVASNWLPAQVPGPGDLAVISASGNYTVTISSNVSVNAIGLTGGSGTRRLNVNGATVTTGTGLAVAASNVLTLSSGTLSGAGTLDLAGTLNTSGNSAINSPVVTHATTAISVAGDSLTVSSGFESQGSLELAAAVPVFLHVNGTLTNASSGTILMSSQGPGFHGYLKGTLDNRGTVTVAGNCSLDRPSAQHQNTGSVSISGGDLTIRQTGSSPGFTGSGGILFINPGRTLHVDGGLLAVVGGSMNGGGGLHLSNGANASFFVVPQISALDMQDATGSFPGTFHTTTTSISLLNSNLEGTVENPAGQVIPIVDSIFEGTLINAGTLDIQGSSSLLAFLDNEGTVTIGHGLVLSSGDTGQLNNGQITVYGGTFAIAQTPAGYVSNGGTLDVLPGATVQVTGGAFRNEVSGRLRGGGAYDMSGTSFLNDGTISPGASPGILTITGDVTLGSTSVLDMEIAGTAPGAGYDQIRISGNVSLNGTLRAILGNGFVPQPGDAFDPVTCGSHTGQFTLVDAPPAGAIVLAFVPETTYPDDPIRLTAVEEAWTYLAPTGNPGGRSRHSAVYDPFSNRLIVFGGFGGSGELNDTWVLTHANGSGGTPAWQPLSPNSALPLARQGHAAAYDPVNNRLIIYGGYSAARPEGFDDVWVLSNANGLGGTPAWQNLVTGGGTPDRRVGGGLGYNPASNRLILFGGVHPVNSCPNANEYVWILTNANGLGGPPIWSALGIGSPPNARSGAVLAYDDGSNRLIVHGGVDACGGVLNDARYLTHADGTGGTPVWTSLPLSAPIAPGRTDHAGVYDVMTDRLITFGGILPNGTTYLDDVLLITGATDPGSAGWTVLPVPSAFHPGTRFDHSASWDPTTRQMIVFGGDSDEGLLSDVSTLHLDLDPGQVSDVPPAPVPPPGTTSTGLGFQRAPWPNPTDGPTSLAFRVPAMGPVTIDVFNVAGRHVGQVFSGTLSAGTHEIEWNGTGTSGRLSSGVYYVVLRSGKDIDTQRIVVAR